MTTTSQRLDLLLSILKETPSDSFVIFAIAKEYESMDDQKEAIKYYEKLYQLDPNYVGLYFHWGKIREEMDEAAKAIDIYTLGIEVAVLQKDGHTERELRAAKYNCELLN